MKNTTIAGDTEPLESVNWTERLSGAWTKPLVRLEGLTLRFERLIRRIVRHPELNPVYHSGTITIFLLGLVFLSGIYLTMFFQFGFEASYNAVDAMENHLVGRVMRAMHRYASIGSIVMAAIHGWRTFVMRRFAGPRRMPWATGVAMVAVLWVIGVTGYWLIWDERAQVFNEALTRAIGGTSAGLDFLVDHVLTDAAGSGWAFMLMLITVHVGLSVGIGALLWYHLRRLSRRHWLAPPIWLWIVGLTVLIVSIVVPVGMLDAVDRHLLPGAVPLDPFFLFLLPGTLSWPPVVTWGIATLVLALVVFFPWVVRVRTLPPIVVSEERCIGCTYCVADCPYDALEMADREDGPHQLLAVAKEDKCVSCGICIGSCPTEALTLGNEPAEPLWAQAATGEGRTVAFLCERHALQGAGSRVWHDDGDDPLLIPLPCVGMAHPGLAAQAMGAGATAVRFVGCPADDCANLEGNVWLQERLDRERRPRLKQRHLDLPIVTAWLPPDDTYEALHSEPTAPATIRSESPLPHWERLVPAGLLVLAVGLVTVAVTMIPFDPGGNDEATVEIVLDHRDGNPLVIDPENPPPADGVPARMVLEVDGEVVLDDTYGFVNADDPKTSLALERVTVQPGNRQVELVLYDGESAPRTIFDDAVALDAGQVLTIDILDAQVVARADAGRALYLETTIGTNAGCRICHSLDENVTLVGPSFGGVATRAETRVPGMSAEDYLRESILDPDAYVVEGFPAGQMIPNYLDILSAEDVENLVAFLLTLE